MKVLFVYPDIEGVEHYGAKKFYHGIGYLSSFVKAHGHQTGLLYLQSELTRGAFLDEIERSAPGLIAFSTTTNQFPFVQKYAALIKAAAPRLPVLVGGVHPTLAPTTVIADPHIDMACLGEGEDALLELMNALDAGQDYTTIPNLWVKRDGETIQNPMRPLMADLDRVPFADRELFGFADILAQNDGWVDLMAGRGCPYDCSYCCNPGLKKSFRGLGRYVRYRSVANVLAEIKELAQHYPVKTLNFQDDVFTLDHDWTLAFCQAYPQAFQFPFWLNTRVERIADEGIVKALAAAGCRGVRIGLESGNEQLRREVLKRKMSNDDIRRVFRLVEKYGLETYTCNMLGLPGETPAMIQETIDFNRELAPDKLQFSVFYPYPMTELHDKAVAMGLYQDGTYNTSYYDKKSLLNNPDLPQAEISKGYDKFVELKAELELKRRSPARWRVYDFLRRYLYGGDALRLRRQIEAVRRWRRWLRRWLRH